MGTPYTWHPDGTHRTTTLDLRMSDLIAADHQVFRVISVDARPADLAGDYPFSVILMMGDGPVTETTRGTENGVRSYSVKAMTRFDRYTSDHYPACGRCGDPTPCRDVTTDRIVAGELARSDLYATPGVCPDCREVISHRQGSVTYPENLRVPGGPPVTFHTRRSCWSLRESYEKAWLLAGFQAIGAEQESLIG